MQGLYIDNLPAISKITIITYCHFSGETPCGCGRLVTIYFPFIWKQHLKLLACGSAELFDLCHSSYFRLFFNFSYNMAVCAKDGSTYQNVCLMQCAGFPRQCPGTAFCTTRNTTTNTFGCADATHPANELSSPTGFIQNSFNHWRHCISILL